MYSTVCYHIYKSNRIWRIWVGSLNIIKCNPLNQITALIFLTIFVDIVNMLLEDFVLKWLVINNKSGFKLLRCINQTFILNGNTEWKYSTFNGSDGNSIFYFISRIFISVLENTAAFIYCQLLGFINYCSKAWSLNPAECLLEFDRGIF